MLVGWGGNNGSTLTGAIYARQLGLRWRTKDGEKSPNFWGSLTQASTVCLGTSSSGKEVHVPMKSLLPMVEPEQLVLDGWDISGLDLSEASERARVLDWDLQKQLKPHLSPLKPRPAIYDNSFIAANQEDRADNVIRGNKQQQLDQVLENTSISITYSKSTVMSY